MSDPFEKTEYIPTPDEVAAFVESLKLNMIEGEIESQNVKDVINKMPSSKQIKSSMSDAECQAVFESVRWVWKSITGKDLVDMSKVEKPAENLQGNYWMLKNGLMISGPNHYTMIKQNLNLFRILLNIPAFTLHEKLAHAPEELIKLVIDSGAVRVFINSEKTAYFQMNDKSYGDWGRAKVKNLRFDKKIVKLIDKSIEYTGWKDGITILL